MYSYDPKCFQCHTFNPLLARKHWKQYYSRDLIYFCILFIDLANYDVLL